MTGRDAASNPVKGAPAQHQTESRFAAGAPVPRLAGDTDDAWEPHICRGID